MQIRPGASEKLFTSLLNLHIYRLLSSSLSILKDLFSFAQVLWNFLVSFTVSVGVGENSDEMDMLIFTRCNVLFDCWSYIFVADIHVPDLVDYYTLHFTRTGFSLH